MWPNPQFPADLVTFTEEILNGKLPFFVQWRGNTDQKKADTFYAVYCSSKDFIFLVGGPLIITSITAALATDYLGPKTNEDMQL